MTLLAVNDAVRAVTDRLDGGFLQIYDGEVVLVQMRFADPAFEPPVDGVAVANPLTVGKARISGVAQSWAAMDAAGTPVLMGVAGDSMLVNQRGITAGADVRVTGFSYRQVGG